MKNDYVKGSVLTWEGRPPFKELLPLALQHIVAMVVGCVTPAIIVGGITNSSAQDTALLVQSALLIAGIATIIQLFPIGRNKLRLGSGLPLIMGVSFAYIPSLISIGGQFGIATILGAQLIGGITAILFGFLIQRIRAFFPPLVSGTVVFTIGLSLYPTAINYMAGGSGHPDYGKPHNWAIAFATLAVVVGITHFSKGFLKLSALLIGVIFGYVVCLFLGMIDFTEVSQAAWFQLPRLGHFGLDYNITAILSIVILYIINSIQAMGDISAVTVGAMDRFPTDPELSGGIIGNGIASILGALFGGLPSSTFGQNVGIVTVTRVINRYVFLIASIVMLTAGFLPKVSALLTTIPQCVLGGATITVFASITTTGMRLIISEELTPRNTAIVGLAVALGVGITQAPDALQYFPSWVMTIFGSSSVVITTIAAIFLNQLIPKEKPAIQGTSTLQPNDASELDRLINLKEPDPID